MYNNNYMYGVERSSEYLAHYGIRGMKWGVRKAIKSGNSARLSKQYAKASKKLAKLEKRAANTGKYARRAALMGAGAAAAGGLAAVGTEGVSKGIKGASAIASKVSPKYRRNARALASAGKMTGLGSAADAVSKWGNSNTLGKAAGGFVSKNSDTYLRRARTAAAKGKQYGLGAVSNNTIARVGAGVVGVGLAAGAAKNAYRAATAKKKAAKFKTEMNKAFAGTKYANGGNRQGKKRRR